MKNDLYHPDYQIASKKAIIKRIDLYVFAQYKDDLQSIQTKNKDPEKRYEQIAITAVIVS